MAGKDGRHFDIAIIGGGLTGLALALALGGRSARMPLSVAVIERMAPDPDSVPRDARSSSIAPASRAMFEALGLWGKIAKDAQPVREIVVTDSGPDMETRPRLLRFGADSGGGAGPLFHMVENHVLAQALLKDVAAAPDIEILAPATLSGFKAGADGIEVALDGGRWLKARLLAGADGRASKVREMAGLEVTGWRYDQMGIATTIAHDRPHRGVAEEHFLPAGPFAVLPLTGNRASLVWSEARADAEQLMALDDDGFLNVLRRKIGTHLGAVSLDGPRKAFPLSMHLAREYVAQRLVLIGDAAHAVHPIAGLGLNLGFRDAAALAECVADAARLGLDPGAGDTLARYQSWRRFDTVAAVTLCDGLNRLFSSDNATLRGLRGAGLKLVDATSPLKRFFVREAAGLGADAPKLLRGELV